MAGGTSLACPADSKMFPWSICCFEAGAGGLCFLCGLCSQWYFYGLNYVASMNASMWPGLCGAFLV
jgi:hypothetical protein